MASMQEYLERKTDEELRVYCMGRNDISADSVLHICHLLAQRDETLPDPYGLFLSLCRIYS